MRVREGLALSALLALLCAPALAQQRQPRVAPGNAFDGAWSVEVITERGDCDRAYRYAIVVENGRARYGGPENFDVNGQIQRDGAVRASIVRGQDRADVTGRLAGNRGRGTWTTSGGRACSGSWNAERRG